jgi:hypothetical protein
MLPRCEVCENYRPDVELPGDRKTVTVRFSARQVVLCVGHARIAERSGVTSFEALRAHYGAGRRSFVPRRGRASHGAGAGERQGAGRRASDV